MRAVILDSDKQNIKYLSDFIRGKYDYWAVNAYATTFALATAVYDEFKGDVELLIVYADTDSSIDLAKDLQEYFPHIRIIFYSNTTDCAEKIFRAVPTFFLRLPFQKEIVAMALERVRMACEEDIGRTLTIQSRGQKQRIRFSAIRYIESSGRKMFLYTDAGAFETYMTVEDALGKLPPQFMQCHRSYIINSDKIEKYSADGILLTGRTLVPISRSYQKKIKEILG
ncbi:MAG: LytTR family transcriptional regulator DNA-binding domain-containing protein [Acetatifactor sp.]|nr:LytTR family transcriptional regulator DNA-binding domain-containing protein [Acetatifactor sp.]